MLIYLCFVVLLTSIKSLIVAFLILNAMLLTSKQISGLDWLQTHSHWPTFCLSTSFLLFDSSSDKLCLIWCLILTHSKFFMYSFWSIVILSFCSTKIFQLFTFLFTHSKCLLWICSNCVLKFLITWKKKIITMYNNYNNYSAKGIIFMPCKHTWIYFWYFSSTC